MIVDAGYNYADMRGVSLVGTAEIHIDDEALNTYAESIAGRYQQGLTGDTGSAAKASAAKRAVVKINVERVMSWDHRKLAGGY